MMGKQASKFIAARAAVNRLGEIYRSMPGQYKAAMRKHTALIKHCIDEINDIDETNEDAEHEVHMTLFALYEYLSDQESEYLPKLIKPILDRLAPIPDRLKDRVSLKKKEYVEFEIKNLSVDPTRIGYERKE